LLEPRFVPAMSSTASPVSPTQHAIFDDCSNKDALPSLSCKMLSMSATMRSDGQEIAYHVRCPL